MSFLWQLLLLSFVIILGRNTASCRLNKFLHDKNPHYVDLGFPIPKKTKEGNESGDHWYLESGCAPTQLAYEEDVEKIPIDKRIVPLVVIDISSKVNGNPNYTITLEDAQSCLDNVTLAQMKKWPTFVVFKIGWSKFYYEDKKKYLGISNNHSQANLPGITPELVKWILSGDSDIQVVGIGNDYPVVKNYKDNYGYASQTTIDGGFYLVEGLNLETTLPPRECTVIISPLEVQKTTKTFVNVLAICPGDSQDEHNEEGEDSSEQKCECKTHEKPESNEDHESDDHTESSGGHKSHKCKKHKHEAETTEQPTTESPTGHKHEHQTDKPPKQTPATSSPPVKQKPDNSGHNSSFFPGQIGNLFNFKDKIKL